MRRVLRRATIIATLTALAACRDGGFDASGPSATSVASVVIVGVPASVETGATVRLFALARDVNGHGLTRAFGWTSSNTAVATVSFDGLVTGVAPGSTLISASTGGKTGSVSLTVSPAPAVPVATIIVSPPHVDLEVGAAAQFTALVQDADGNPLSGRSVSWSSTSSIATVDDSGRVSALSPGTTEITATSGGKSGSTAVTILPKTGLDISLSTTISALRFVVAIDGGALPEPQMFNVAAATGTPATGRLAVSLPPGGPYRVRALAIDASANEPSSYSELVVGATGRSEGAMVSNGSRTVVSVDLSRPNVQVSAPTEIQGGLPVTITWTYTDLGDVLESFDRAFNKPVGFLNYARQSFIDGATSSAIVASATKVSAGVYQFSASFTAPPSAGPLYYQTEAIALYVPLAEGSDNLGGYLFNPSSARGEALGVISIH